MHKFKLIKITLFLLIFSYENNLFAQRIADPLNPEKFQTQREFGFLAGIGANIQLGSFKANCDCPHFDTGSGFGYTLGALYEQDINPVFQWGFAGLYKSLYIRSSYQINKLRYFQSTKTNDYDSALIAFTQIGETNVSMLSVMPYLKMDLSNWLFVRLGFEAGYLLNANIKHTEELLQNRVTLIGSGLPVTVEYNNGRGNSVVVQDSALTMVNSFQMYVTPQIGFNIPLAENVNLSPLVDFSFPLNKISENINGFKIWSWRVLCELRIALQMRQESEKYIPDK